MIIFKNDKYACVKCIRGHRSSLCVHTGRMLVKVRNRGRKKGIDVRDAIVVGDIHRKRSCECASGHAGDDSKQYGAPNADVSRPHESGLNSTCVGMNKQPILFVRAKKVLKAQLIGGELKEMSEVDMSRLEVDTSDDETVATTTTVPKVEILDNNVLNVTQGNIDDDMVLVDDTKNFAGASIGELIDEQLSSINVEPTGSHCCGSQPHGIDPMKTTTVTAAATETEKYPFFQLLTKRGVYLSTQCSCSAANCACSNCLIHRTEEEINNYIEASGVPLTNLDSSTSLQATPEIESPRPSCMCKPEECTCDGCDIHTIEVVPFQKIVIHGLINTRLTKKTLIQYRKKLIGQKYWWDYCMVYIPCLRCNNFDGLDIVGFFDNIIKEHGHELEDAKEKVDAGSIQNLTSQAENFIMNMNNSIDNGVSSNTTNNMNNINDTRLQSHYANLVKTEGTISPMFM